MRPILVMCLCATACTEVPAPTGDTGPPTNVVPDGSVEKVCQSIGTWQNLSAQATFAADGLTSQLTYWAAVPGADGKRDIFGTFGYALSSRDVNFPVKLGVGSNAAWRTSTHAMLLWRGCDTDSCDDGPYYSVGGIAMFSQVAQALNDPFAAKFWEVRFERIEFGEDDSFEVVAGAPCFVLPYWNLAGLASKAATGGGGGTSSGVGLTESSAAQTAAPDDAGVPDAP